MVQRTESQDLLRVFRIPVALAIVIASVMSVSVAARKPKTGLAEILSRMNDTAKRLKTVTANLEYTTVTVVVNDKSTEYGQLFYRNSTPPEIKIEFEKPDRKVILFKKNKAQIYLPNANQIQEYELQQRSELVQQFLALGFGTHSADLKRYYDIKLLSEENLGGDTTALLELTPRSSSVAGQLTKVQLWISEDSWLPVQQKFFQTSGDYLVAHYTGVKVNRNLPGSTFQIQAEPGAKRVKMQ